MKLDEKSQPLTAFTIPRKGKFQWVTSPKGLLGCPASFQQLMEEVLRNRLNAIVYIDDLLIHLDMNGISRSWKKYWNDCNKIT